MGYRKWSVPADIATMVEAVAQELGYTKRRQRWNLLAVLAHYARVHPDIFRKR